MSILENKVVNFCVYMVAGIAWGLVHDNPHGQNFVESGAVGAMDLLLFEYTKKITCLGPAVGKALEDHSNTNLVRERLPYTMAGYMAGQTIAKLVQL